MRWPPSDFVAVLVHGEGDFYFVVGCEDVLVRVGFVDRKSDYSGEIGADLEVHSV